MRVVWLHILAFCTLIFSVVAFTKEDHEIFRVRDELEAAEGKDVTFYDFVGVQSSATVDDILKSFRKKSRSLHPDKAKHSFVASKSTPAPKKPGEKKKPGTHVSKGPSEREINNFLKEANERYKRLGVVRDILRGPQRERYDHFLQHGFPAWKGTGYYYTRYRPGLGTVLIGLFLFGGGAAHYATLRLSYRRQREFLEKYLKNARKQAWGDESGISGISGIGEPVAVPQPVEEPQSDSMAGLNRRQKREMERQTKKEAKSGKGKNIKVGGAVAAAPTVVEPTGERRKIRAENGKILIVDSVGNVFLQEENEDGETVESLLDLDEVKPPTIYDTALIRFPLWLYRRAFDPFLKDTTPVPSDEVISIQPEIDTPPMVGTPMSGQAAGMTESQELTKDYEVIDSTGIDSDMGVGGTAKKRKKNKK